ncbi:beta strand repeat-containing protein [Pirellula sp. SH-Sr6A]|uniref:beta strand repeat-containing protein n=1 Tax=Pirellula sp. SH-Sr6A TaxID=1632865 RepID=UPI00143AF11C|nr:PEP-CTERM sorting domain-containing protein [Pirellula sp. SH-Sr6A]
MPTSSSTALFVNNGANSKNIDFAGGANIANGVRFAAGSSAYTFRPFSGVGLQLQGSNSFLENLGGNNQQINAGVTFSGAGSKTISATSTGGLQFGGSVSNTAASALTISKSGTGAIAFTGSLTSNAGLAITNSNATGNVTIGNATVSGSTVSVGGTGATSFTGTLTNAAGVLTLTKAGTGTLSTSGISSAAGVSISNSGTGVTTIGSISNTSGNVAISNSAAATLNVGAITGGGNLQITNSDATGVVRLNNNVGASTVSFSGGGRVEVASGVTVNGSTAVSGAGSSLTGLGSFGNSVVIQNGGTLSPGVSGAGSLAFNGGLAFDSGSTFSWDLVNTTTGFDTVAVSGGSGLSINSGATSVLNISNAIDASFWNTNQSWNVFTGTFAAPGSVFGNITLAGAAPDVTKGFFTWSSSTNGVTLNFTAVPEPSSMALLGLAGVIGGAYARRRNKLAKRLTAAC